MGDSLKLNTMLSTKWKVIQLSNNLSGKVSTFYLPDISLHYFRLFFPSKNRQKSALVMNIKIKLYIKIDYILAIQKL